MICVFAPVVKRVWVVVGVHDRFKILSRCIFAAEVNGTTCAMSGLLGDAGDEPAEPVTDG